MAHDLLSGCPLGVLSFGEKRVSIKKFIHLNSFHLTVKIQMNEMGPRKRLFLRPNGS